ncbi:hypothetical protein BDN70DRAFT_936860 [Pholiota conissans]|uniref:Uncharacterized protein n=1 Tax=Pholiota conissans TaxID=109636 RepID=A0A9P5YSC0_9AGAR|nr:hypothetical protein BDN70DRAFT_936860 [Pholiota conissans]
MQTTNPPTYSTDDLTNSLPNVDMGPKLDRSVSPSSTIVAEDGGSPLSTSSELTAVDDDLSDSSSISESAIYLEIGPIFPEKRLCKTKRQKASFKGRPTFLDIYFFYEDPRHGPRYPALFKVVVYGPKFIYSLYPNLVELVDCTKYPLRIYDRIRRTWTHLDVVNGFDCSEPADGIVDTGFFLIIRLWNHNRYLSATGYPDLMLELAVRQAEHEKAGSAHHVRVICPAEKRVEIDVRGVVRKDSWLSKPEQLVFTDY